MRAYVNAVAGGYGIPPDDLWTAFARQCAPWAFPDGPHDDANAPAYAAGFSGGSRRPERPTGAPERRLAGLLDRVLSAAVGHRNDTLNWAAHIAGQMIAAGDIDEQLAVNALYRAALHAGLSHNEIVGHDGRHGTLWSGINAGKAGKGA